MVLYSALLLPCPVTMTPCCPLGLLFGFVAAVVLRVFLCLSFSPSPPLFPHLGSTTWTWSCKSGWTALTATISFIPNSITSSWTLTLGHLERPAGLSLQTTLPPSTPIPSSWTLHSGCYIPLS
ncbi:unnamed protein product [Boreogadus saida]